MPSKYDAPRYQATVGGTWPDGHSFAAGAKIAADRIPEADKHRLIQAGVLVPLWPDEPAEVPAEVPAETEEADDPSKRAWSDSTNLVQRDRSHRLSE